MNKIMRVIVAQMNPIVGDIEGNLQKIIEKMKIAKNEMRADVILFPELCITGYPPEDLLLREDFISRSVKAIKILTSVVPDIYCIIGHPHPSAAGLLNTVSVLYQGRCLETYAKQYLPNEGVFDEKRYFVSGDKTCVLTIHGMPIGILICEDIWHPDPMKKCVDAGAHFIFCFNASPFEIDKQEKRQLTIGEQAAKHQVPVVYANVVGGQDELIFDGGSSVFDHHGKIIQQASFFKEEFMMVELQNKKIISKNVFKTPTPEENVYQALILGIRDYVEKNHFPGVIIGVSGGIDSALTLAIAVDALGADRVLAAVLPSRYTSAMSLEDLATLIKTVKVGSKTISIDPVVATLTNSFDEHLKQLTLENIQARCRGLILMALSNDTGKLVLNTGNRSELAVGYCTLYGDMVGALGVLKDISKTWVYRLANYRNQLSHLIPQRIIDRPPSAELYDNQTDQDTLPPYDILDKIIELYIDQAQSVDAIIKKGFDAETVVKIIQLIHKMEYKRRQAPIGIRIHHTAFGRDRRYPMTSYHPE